MIYTSPEDIVLDDIFFQLLFPEYPHRVCIKLEGFSMTNSIKLKPARSMIDRFEREGKLAPGGTLIESSSGNLGVALSMICAARGYRFICVTDPNISRQNAGIIAAHGAELVIVRERDQNGGFLGTRISYIQQMLREDTSLVWVNQYENLYNPRAHYDQTARQIAKAFPHIDYLFIGAGTTGTLGGVSRYFQQHRPETYIIAVEPVGSVTFGTPAGRRVIPGLGTSSPPFISRSVSFDQLVRITERETVRMCHQLARRGLLLGGSSGTVLCAVHQMLPEIPPDAVIVAISPDMGDRYIDSIYCKSWVNEHFGEGVFDEHYAGV